MASDLREGVGETRGAESAGQKIEVGEGEEDVFRAARPDHTEEGGGKLRIRFFDETLARVWRFLGDRLNDPLAGLDAGAYPSSAVRPPEDGLTGTSARIEDEDRIGFFEASEVEEIEVVVHSSTPHILGRDDDDGVLVDLHQLGPARDDGGGFGGIERSVGAAGLIDELRDGP